MAKTQGQKIVDLNTFKQEVNSRFNGITTKSDLDGTKVEILVQIQHLLQPQLQSTGTSNMAGNQSPPFQGRNASIEGYPPRQPLFHHKINIPTSNPDVNRECT